MSKTEIRMSHTAQVKLYRQKNKYLKECFNPVDARSFYRDLFPEGSFERKGEMGDHKPNAIALDFSRMNDPNKKLRGIDRYIVTDDLDLIDEFQKRPFVIISPIGYYGGNRTIRNASLLYALTFDIDDVTLDNLIDLIYEIDNKLLPRPTYLVNTGTGLHLYYVFDRPLPLYPSTQAIVNQLKVSLTMMLWNRFTSSNPEPQIQKFNQGFRVIGSNSKIGSECRLTAFQMGYKIKIEYLAKFLPHTNGMRQEFDLLVDQSRERVSLAAAKELYPDWYERKIVERQTKGHWNFNEKMYENYLERIKSEIHVGHRYFAIMGLAIFAIKCGISEERLRGDAYELLDTFDGLSVNKNNRFTEQDVESALRAYNDSYATFTRSAMEKITGMTFPATRRNYESREDHLEAARAKKERMKRRGEKFKNPEGRPNVQRRVLEWRKEHPDGRKSDCIRDTGFAKHTVLKWWDTLEVPEVEVEKSLDFLYK